MKLIFGILPICLFAQSSITLRTSGPPAVPGNSVNLTVVGTKGNTPYYYWLITHYPIGSTGTTGPVFINTAPNALSGANYVNITWQAVNGAISYDLLRTSTPNQPTGTCTCAVSIGTTSTSVNDTGAALGVYSVPVPIPTAVANILLNNRDYSVPTVTIDTPMNLPPSTYSSLLTNSLSRTIQQKFTDVVTLDDFATCDGVTDITSKLQNALNSGAGELRITSGNCVISSPSTLTWPSNDINVVIEKGASLSGGLPAPDTNHFVTDNNQAPIILGGSYSWINGQPKNFGGMASLTANSPTITTTEVKVISYNIPSSFILPGTTFRVKAQGTCVSSAANTTSLIVRLGTTGTSSDTAILLHTLTAATSGSNVPFNLEYIITFRSTSVASYTGYLWNGGTTGISTTVPNALAPATVSGLVTNTSLIIQFSAFTSASTTSIVFQNATIEIVKP
jgi:hypothetical protein